MTQKSSYGEAVMGKLLHFPTRRSPYTKTSCFYISALIYIHFLSAKP